MPNIKLTPKELDHLRTYYEYELDEARKYIEQLKFILAKLDTADRPSDIKPVLATDKIAKPARKRGRPPKAKAEIPVKAENPKPEKKPGRPKKVMVEPREMLPEVMPVISAEKPVVVEEPVKAPIASAPKPKRKRTSNYRTRGVFLRNLSKPFPKVPKDDSGIPYGSKDIQTP